MKSMSRKIILAGGALVLTAACAVTVTYAWFARNNVAWIDEYDYNVKSSAGVLISTDGTHFTQNVSKSEIKKVIEAWAGEDANYSELKYGQSTLGTYESGDITIDENGYPKMYTVTPSEIEIPEDEKDNYDYDNVYEMVMADASHTDYLSFDLWLRYENTAKALEDCDLYFDIDTTISSAYTNKEEKYNIALNNKLTLVDGTELDSGDTVSYDPADAMRVLVTNVDNSNVVLYEPSLGLGSAAVEGATDDIHNKDKNAMYTYWNSIHGDSAFTQAAHDGNAYLNTEESFQKNPISTFKYDSEYENPVSKLNFRDIHLVITVFMEGWDADYIIGTPNEASSFKVNLAFTVNNPNENNGD